MGSFTRSIGILLLSVGSLCVGLSASRADYHAQAEVFMEGAGSPGNHTGIYFDGHVAGPNTASLGTLDNPLTGTGNGNGDTTTSAFASVEPFGDSLFKLATAASSDRSGGFVPQAISRASGGWKDVIFDSGPSTPATIRLHFRIEGGLSGQRLNGNNQGGEARADATVGVTFVDSNSLLTARQFGYSGLSSLQYFASFTSDLSDGFGHITPSNFQTSGFSHFSGTVNAFSADFSFDVKYDGRGYAYSMFTFAGATAAESNAAASFGSTIKLTGISLTNGDAIPERDLSFQSGFRLRSVPEPASLTMLFLGSVGILVHYGSRRNRASVRWRR